MKFLFTKKKYVITGITVIAATGCIFLLSPTKRIDFNTEVKPSLNKKCISCHGGVKAKGGFSVLFREEALAKTESGNPVIIPGDSGVQHNVQIFADQKFSDAPLFDGELVTGPAKVRYEVSALDAGTYYFRCLVHPTMTGTIQVVEGGVVGGGGGSGGPTASVTAQGIAFDTDTIELPADTASTIAFDNKDAGVQHNISINKDDPAAEVLFKGELVTGVAQATYQIPPLPAGEYYFRCDVHPTMNGTVIVGGGGGGGPASPTPTETAAFWDKTQYRGVELFRKTLGIIGFGRIGRRVSQLVAPLQMRIMISDPYIPEESIPPAIQRVSQLEPLLKVADIVSLHCPLTEETRNLIGKKELLIMKKTAFLVNTARGGTVDEEALIEALREGKIAGAAIDTFRQEPPEDLRRLCEAG